MSAAKDSEFMRAELARAGIHLDEAKPALKAAMTPGVAPVDRDAIRAVLEVSVTDHRDLDWLVESCPGLEYALAYKPTRFP